MKVYFLQRLLAYFIDSMVIFLISFLITLFIPISSTYSDALEKSEEISLNYLGEEISEEEYINQYTDVNYVIAKERMVVTIVGIIVTIAYFGAYPYYMGGQTVGKKFVKFKIVDINGKHPDYLNFVLRAAFIHGSVFNLINLIFLLLLNAKRYFMISSCFDFAYFIVIVGSIFMIMFRKDGRGIHDLLFKTKMVSTK